MQQIEQHSNGKAKHALSLIEYDRRLEPAMWSIFGKYVICDDPATAKAVMNMPNGFDCVTLQGDKYERQGVLHGGSQQ